MIANDLDRQDWALLGLLFSSAYRQQGNGGLNADEISRIHPFLRDDLNQIEFRLRRLVEQKLVLHSGLLSYRLSVQGTYFVIQNSFLIGEQEHGLTEDLPEEIVDALDSFWRWVASVSEITPSEAWAVPDPFEQKYVLASDRVVSVNHNSQIYKETIHAVDVVIDAVRGDNEYGARDPKGKMQCLAELEAGKKLLESIRVAVGLVDRVLVKTLLYLAGIGVAVSQISTAIEHIKTLLGP